MRRAPALVGVVVAAGVSASAFAGFEFFVFHAEDVLECGNGVTFHYAVPRNVRPPSDYEYEITKFKGAQLIATRVISSERLRELKRVCDETTFPESALSPQVAGNGQPIAVGELPRDFIAADLNGDAIPELVSANQGSDDVSVLLGNPDGTLQGARAFATGASPVRVEAGDLDGDGKTDVVTANGGTGLAGNLSFLRGNGDGTLQAPVAISAGTAPSDVAVANFDAGPALDLVAADSAGSAVVVRLGNGDGTFQAPLVLPTSSVGSFSIAVGDLDLDGSSDIVTNDSILLGNGVGGFAPAAGFPGPVHFGPVDIGDFDGDGKLDVVMVGRGEFVSVFRGKGDGTVEPPRHYVVCNAPEELAIADMDADGVLDLVVSSESDPHLSLLFGNGDGTFVGAPTYVTTPNLSNRLGAYAVAVADFSGDGLADVAVANGGTPSNGQADAVVLPGLGAGQLGPPVFIDGQDGSSVVTGDFNGDTKQDLAFGVEGSTGQRSSALSVVLANGNLTFTAPTTLSLPDDDAFAESLVAADLNGDAKLDLVAANTGTANLSPFLGDGAGGFAAQPTVAVGTFPSGLVDADFDGNGMMDLAVVNRGDLGVANGSVSILLGNGDGSFQPGPTLLAGTVPDSVAVGELNGDGRVDLAVVVEAPIFDWSIDVLLGNGDGTFAAPLRVPLTNDLVGAVRIADLNADGRRDLVVSLDGPHVAILAGKGDGSFEAPRLFHSGGGSPFVANIDEDGLPDVVVASGVGLAAVLINVSDEAGTCRSIVDCDDADACTDDACAAGTCAFTPVAGIAGVRCRLAAAREPLCGTEAVDPKVAAAVAKNLNAVQVLVDRAEQNAKKQKKLFRKAGKRVTAILQKAAKAQRKDKVSDGCATQIEETMSRLRELLLATAG